MAALGVLAPTAAITMSSASGPITALQLVAPTNQAVLVKEIAISMNGITAADAPVLWDIVVQTTAGTMTSLTSSLVKENTAFGETIQMTAQHTATVEPTTTDVKWREYYHEMTGGVMTLKNIRIPGGGRLGVRYTSGTLTATTKCVVSARCEE